ncbi:MAG TPA: hypothetical protein VKT77_00460, partial [Chthonomonadaceae bacterium]|nr:hypothetical protein [Chthonomonadaceae bacterium]
MKTTESAAGRPRSVPGLSLSTYSILVATGAFATTFAQQRVLAKYPTTFLLKDHLHLGKEQVAVFFFWATFAWNIKPLAGILTDAFPLFGTRRRSYMALGSIGAALCWLTMALFPSDYRMLLGTCVAMNVATVLASTVMGGLMVEAGHTFGVSGRISALRQVVQSIAGICAPLIGGYFAGSLLGWTKTTVVGAASVAALAVITLIYLREPRTARSEPLQAFAPRQSVSPVVWIGIIAASATVLHLLRLGEEMRTI